MEYFNCDISALVIVFLSLAFLAALYSAIFGMSPIRRVARYGRRAAAEEDKLLNIADDKLPSVTVVVYARNAEHNLRNFIETIERQNYPHFEIVIVNDGSVDMTKEIAETLEKEYDNIKYTFVSNTAKNVSPIKVAYTLGIKAADNEVIVTTASNCRPTSDNWLRLLCAPLSSPTTGISLGYSYVPQEKTTDNGRWDRAFDSTMSAAEWLGAALNDKTFRGDQYNLAFRKHLFFDNRGYASSTALYGGHDDIFINEIARRAKCAVALHPDAQMVVEWAPEQIQRLYRDARDRRLFVAGMLKSSAFLEQTLNNVAIWLTLAFSVVAILLSVPNFFPILFSLVIIFALWGYEICLYRRTATLLKNLVFTWTVPLRWLTRPVLNFIRGRKAKSDNGKQYTWSVGMQR